ncbi:hypothetical protein HYDPIDRAFT_110018 [Hydnomerulius pinastri MD-312]|nr:hypothetical protein HYDPIDRAFT_110018 [Hydnomerulius pinastri MD-312]
MRRSSQTPHHQGQVIAIGYDRSAPGALCSIASGSCMWHGMALLAPTPSSLQFASLSIPNKLIYQLLHA